MPSNSYPNPPKALLNSRLLSPLRRDLPKPALVPVHSTVQYHPFADFHSTNLRNLWMGQIACVWKTVLCFAMGEGYSVMSKFTPFVKTLRVSYKEAGYMTSSQEPKMLPTKTVR